MIEQRSMFIVNHLCFRGYDVKQSKRQTSIER